jgi:hypothetical protein
LKIDLEEHFGFERLNSKYYLIDTFLHDQLDQYYFRGDDDDDRDRDDDDDDRDDKRKELFEDRNRTSMNKDNEDGDSQNDQKESQKFSQK